MYSSYYTGYIVNISISGFVVNKFCRRIHILPLHQIDIYILLSDSQ